MTQPNIMLQITMEFAVLQLRAVLLKYSNKNLAAMCCSCYAMVKKKHTYEQRSSHYNKDI